MNWASRVFVGVFGCALAVAPADSAENSTEKSFFQCEVKLENVRETLADLQKDYEFMKSTYDAVLGSAIKAHKDLNRLKDENSQIRYCVALAANLDEAVLCLKR